LSKELKQAFDEVYDTAMRALDATHPCVPLKGDAADALDHLMAVLTECAKWRNQTQHPIKEQIMSKAIVTFTDKPDGNVSCTVEFDPQVSKDSKSAAQVMAVRLLTLLKRRNDSESDDEDDGADRFALCGAPIAPGEMHPDDCEDCAESAEAS
jgi:hypothetical protein